MNALNAWNKTAEEMLTVAQEEMDIAQSTTKNCRVPKNMGGTLSGLSRTLVPYTLGISMIGVGLGSALTAGTKLTEKGIIGGRVKMRIKPLAGSFIDKTMELIKAYPAVQEPGERLVALICELSGSKDSARPGEAMVENLRGVLETIKDIRRILSFC